MTNEEFINSIKLEGEEWREIPNMEGFYMASTLGRILSLGRYVKSKNNSFKWKPPHLMTQSKTKCGYLSVHICYEGNAKPHLVHRLVSLTFLPKENGKEYVDHIDANKENNKVSNLRWCTMSENMQNENTMAYLRRFYTNDTRKKHQRPVVAIKDCIVVKTYQSIKSVANDGHSADNVFQACNHIRKRRKHHGFVWMYLSDYQNLVNMSKNSLSNPR